MAALLSLVGFAIAVYCIWILLAGVDQPSRIFFTVISCLIIFPIVQFLVAYGCVGFVARQLFPTRTVVWVSANAFAFQSRLLLKPVAIWRQWKGQTVRLSFILNRDNDAAIAAANLKPNQRSMQPHFNEAMILEIVVSASNVSRPVASSEQLMRRTIPMTEVSTQNARKFTTVLAAAVAVTSKPTESTRETGVDVDG